MRQDPIIIAGGGIGGLAAAIALARKGFQVTVLERASRYQEIGAGIQLGPNAFHAFDRLELGDAARSIAVFIDRLRLMDAISAEEITNIDLTDYFRRRFGNPYAVVHRGDLHGIFVRACEAHANVTLRTDCDVVGYEQNGAQASALLKSGERVTGCLLIGADGLRSRIRQQMVGDGAPRIAGHTTYRSVIPTEQMPEDLRWNAATLWAGAKCHLVHYPLSGWKVFNLAITCHNDPAEAFAARPVTHEEVLAGFRDVHPRAKAIIHHGRDWKAWVTSDRDPTDRWVDGRVVLLGDAAHPMLQYFAQGACMALEDAIWLAEELDERKGDIAHALDRYRNARLLRTARVQLQARELGTHVYHPAGVHALLRNQLIRETSLERFCENLAWLYQDPFPERRSNTARKIAQS
ncbi:MULTISPECIES: 3-hydroxybenzoate 6-monooxygenase [Bradyrhizobium]|jgi:2-polyprenyl-6-methoxyphenol hydroxylase-like FAD-dependent oxidoreductase|uniref:2-polyprenyl-6-methoxyphenol hydroxylase-like FAD-dependent oxidoreductase n=1 Tax=Bradyrhizobium japonicum TaxID=375 RepID=A0ABV2S3I5_BRAJP|nr:3-hydroxybenzoate 6-monooxygenase [Bradyrhizobium japonicum]KMJ97358.1 salicylate hydroxylase [Bradyrhizobium japonicum]MBR0764634.1 3-hydroxybenzoate 6-monooxygenase [Bradyrhizobium japonicum]MCS3538311.1 salicylate hydroxylase [Bradyrhizobium japonicum]MCS3985602.1 salicylate hydroxylase [Bradyrhizobium japonicum]MCS4019582.1 salicylate hydroxylase [Bradyrhizobium japonicum]